MAKRLLAKGHEVTMVCGSFGEGKTGLSGPFVRGRRTGVVDGIDVIEFELPYSNRDGFIRRTITFLRFAIRSIGVALEVRCDLVFATSTPLTAGIPGIVATWIRRKPFVFEVRDLWPELPRAMGVIRNRVVLGLMSALEWASYHSAAACIGLAPGIIDGILRRGVARDRVHMIPNGCDLDMFSPDRDLAVRPVEIGAREFMAVFTGAHGIANGLDAVLNAAAVLRERDRHDIKFVFVGEGREKPRLVERAHAESLSNCVFLDSIPKTALTSLMLAADVGLMILDDVPAFYFGTSPNKFFDYISAGLPVLVNYPGWVADLVTSHDCGFAVPPRDPAAFADALERMADDREGLAAMGVRGRALARREFDRDLLGERFVTVLEEAARR